MSISILIKYKCDAKVFKMFAHCIINKKKNENSVKVPSYCMWYIQPQNDMPTVKR